MRKASSIFFTFSLIVVFCSFTRSYGVDLWAIEEVRNKSVLDESDFQIIDKFVAESIRELLEAKDFTDVARIRSMLLTRSSSEQSSSKGQYRNQFYKSARRHILTAMKLSDEQMEKERKFMQTINLLILIDSLRDVELAELVLEKITDENMAVRYWAVHSVCNGQVIRQLSSSGEGNSDLVREIINLFNKILETSDYLIVAMITRFSTSVGIGGGDELLLKIADMRINQYSSWKVKDEMLDVIVLKSLYHKLSSPNQSNTGFAQRFGQLYSYAIQRYVKGEGRLSDKQKQHIISVIVEIEDECVSKLFGRQSSIKKAIEEKDFEKLIKEHNLLLGDSEREGKLNKKFGFMYRHPDGKESTAPAVLLLPSG